MGRHCSGRLKVTVPSGERPIRQRLVARLLSAWGHRIDEGQAPGAVHPENSIARGRDCPAVARRMRRASVRCGRQGLRLAGVARAVRVPPTAARRSRGRPTESPRRHRDQDLGLGPIFDTFVNRRSTAGQGPLPADVRTRQGQQRLARSLGPRKAERHVQVARRNGLARDLPGPVAAAAEASPRSASGRQATARKKVSACGRPVLAGGVHDSGRSFERRLAPPGAARRHGHLRNRKRVAWMLTASLASENPSRSRPCRPASRALPRRTRDSGNRNGVVGAMDSLRAPRTIASATSSLTAPKRASISASTPQFLLLGGVRIGDPAPVEVVRAARKCP